MSGSELHKLQKCVQDFCEDRDWDQFHNPKDLAIGLAIEASELLEFFRYKTQNESFEILENEESKREIGYELADILFNLLRFTQKFNIDLESAFKEKMQLNNKKYPVEKARGQNKKYTELGG